MKKTLLLQTALVAAAGLFVADIANAQTKEVPIGVTVGGYYNQMFQVQDRDPSPTGSQFRDHGFKTDSEVWFNVRGVLANGTVIGARIELESATYQDQVDERYMFIEHSEFGRVELGSVDSVTTKMIYAAPNSLPNYSSTVHSEYSAVHNAPLMRFVNNLDDNERINLYTASNRYFGSKAGKGLQIGVTYMPDACQDFSVLSNACGGTFLAAPVTAEQQYQAAANYLESFGPVDAALYLGYTSAKILGTGAATLPSKRESGWQAGAQFTYNVGDGSAVQFGGGYNKEDVGVNINAPTAASNATANFAVEDRKAFSLGLRYLTNGAAPGSVGIGAEYWNRKDDVRANAVDIKQDYWHIGLTYQVAAGILGFAGVGVSDTDAPGTTSDVDQTFGVVGINLSF